MGPALPTHPSSIAGAAERRDRDRLRDPRGPFTSFPACPAHQHDEAKDHQAEREQDERLFSDADLTPRSTVSDGQGGAIEVYADGSWTLKIDGFLA